MVDSTRVRTRGFDSHDLPKICMNDHRLLLHFIQFTHIYILGSSYLFLKYIFDLQFPLTKLTRFAGKYQLHKHSVAHSLFLRNEDRLLLHFTHSQHIALNTKASNPICDRAWLASVSGSMPLTEEITQGNQKTGLLNISIMWLGEILDYDGDSTFCSIAQHCEIRPPSPWPNTPLSYIILLSEPATAR